MLKSKTYYHKWFPPSFDKTKCSVKLNSPLNRGVKLDFKLVNISLLILTKGMIDY